MTRFVTTASLLLLLAACASDGSESSRTSGNQSSSSSDQLAGRAVGDLGKGSPAGSKEQIEKVLRDTVGDRVFFLTDRSDLTAEAQTTLRKQADFMRQYPNLTFTIEGHAD